MLSIPAIFEGSRDLKDKSKKLTFGTNEISPETAAGLQMMVQNFVYLIIKAEEFTKEEVDMVNDLKSNYEDMTKTHSQRMRAVLYKLWQQNNEGYKDFNLFYAFKMEGFITHLKSKLL